MNFPRMIKTIELNSATIMMIHCDAYLKQVKIIRRVSQVSGELEADMLSIPVITRTQPSKTQNMMIRNREPRTSSKETYRTTVRYPADIIQKDPDTAVNTLKRRSVLIISRIIKS